MRFYMTFDFLGFKFAKKRTLNLFKGDKISYFRILSGWTKRYKPALSKSDSSWDNSYCVMLVIVSLATNIGKMHPSSVNITFLLCV